MKLKAMERTERRTENESIELGRIPKIAEPKKSQEKRLKSA